MPNINYTENIPAANNDPSDDQPNMLQNTNAINTWNNVDHIGFEDNDGGLHKFVRLNAKNDPGAQSGNQGAIFSQSGSVDTNALLVFRNPTADFPISPIRAMVLFTTQLTTDGNTTYAPTQEFNINGDIEEVRGGGISTMTIELDAGIVTGNDIIVQITGNNSAANDFSYIFTNPDLNIFTAALTGNVIYSVIVYQV